MIFKKGIAFALPVIMLGFILAGCANRETDVQSQLLPGSHAMIPSSKTYPATNPSQVKLYFTKKPSRRYIKIDEISVMDHDIAGTSLEENKINQKLQQAAAQIGGNAITNIRTSLGKRTGTVIRFKK